MQGIVETFDLERGIGIIHGKNGCNYPVIVADLIKAQPLEAGQTVHFSVRFVNNHAFAANVGTPRATPLAEV